MRVTILVAILFPLIYFVNTIIPYFIGEVNTYFREDGQSRTVDIGFAIQSLTTWLRLHIWSLAGDLNPSSANERTFSPPSVALRTKQKFLILLIP